VTPELWQKVCAALDQANGLDPEQRAQFLQQLRRQDATAAAEVESLLGHAPLPSEPSTLPGSPSPPLDQLAATRHDLGPALEDWPTRIGPYDVEGQLGRGGMGVVLRVRDPKFDRPLAVKLLAAKLTNDIDCLRLFRAEAELMGQLQHPGVPPVYDLGELPDGRPFFAMKLVKGQTLLDMLWLARQTVRRAGEQQSRGAGEQGSGSDGKGAREKKIAPSASTENAEPRPREEVPTVAGDSANLSPAINRQSTTTNHQPPPELPRFLHLFEQVCQTIAYAHSHGVIHRDLKPANIMVGAFGEVQVMDWGLARVFRNRDQQSEAGNLAADDPSSFIRHPASAGPVEPGVWGTLAYMAPEQARGEVASLDQRCDVFALGAILCEILTGQPAFFGNSVESLLMRAGQGDLRDAFSRLKACGADASLLDLTRRCLAPDRDRRPADAAAVADAVGNYLAELQQRLKKAEIDEAAARASADAERRRRQAEQARADAERRRRWASLALGAVVTVAVACAGLAFALFQAERERIGNDARRQRVEKETDVILAEEARRAGDLHAQLADYHKVQELISDPESWKRQLDKRADLLAQAEKALANGQGLLGPEWNERLAERRASLAADEKDFVLARELDEIHLESFTFVEDKLNPASAAPRYARFFSERLNLDLNTDTAVQIAEAIRKSRLRQVLVAALDHWADVSRGPKSAGKDSLAKLLETARLADPDRWRDKFRKPGVWYDRLLLERLAAEMKPGEQAPLIQIALANGLHVNGGDGLAVLYAALLHYPQNSWLNLAVAQQSRYASEKAGYYQAALAVRLHSSAAWDMLGATLNRQHKPAEALLAWQKAIVLNPGDWNAHRLIGKVYLAKGRFAEAKEQARKALDLLDAKHPFYRDLEEQWQECDRCAAVQHKEKLQPVLAMLPKEPINDTLASNDDLDFYARPQQSYRKAYAIKLRGGKSYQIDLECNAFDPLLRLESETWQPLMSNDDVTPGVDLNSRLVFTPENDGTYRIIVNSLQAKKTGSYALQMREVVPVGPIKKFDDELSGSDPKHDGKFIKKFEVLLTAGTPYVFELTSQKFDTYLRLLRPDGKIIAVNDDIVPDNFQMSRIDFTPAATGVYALEVTSYNYGETGAFTLTVQGYRAAD
jgi:serine/threonine protein kinase